MRKVNRILAITLAVLCLLSSLPAAVSAANAKNDKLIALTFDDGPGRDTARLLDALRARGVHCTFFMVGASAQYYPSVVRQCYEDGHQIASHTYDHPMLTGKTDEQIRWQLDKTAEILDSAIGCSNTYMVRPPYGDYNQRVLNALRVPAFYWSDDSGDWRTNNSNTVYNNVIRTAGDGDILLLHDSHSWSVDAAIRVVDTLLAQGYEFVTLSELFRRRGVSLEAGKIYFWLRANGTNLPKISKPVITTRAMEQGIEVSIDADQGTKIYYTVDGTIPRANSTLYSKPFLLTKDATVTAVAGYDMNGSRSDPAKLSVKIKRCDSPEVSISGNGEVTITAADPAYYTTNGDTPSTASAQYSAPFTVSPDTVFTAIAYSGKENEISSMPVCLYYSPKGNVFDDVMPGRWYLDAVDEAAAMGLMVGTGKYHFSPNSNMTRAQMVSVLYRASRASAPAAASGFPDVPEGKWFSDAISWAKEAKIAAGYPDGKFYPDKPISREESAAILMRYTAYCDYSTAGRASLDRFLDSGSVSGYAEAAVSWSVAGGWISGTGENLLSPKSFLTRAQMASMIIRYLKVSENWEKVHLTDEALLELSGKILPLLQEKDLDALQAYVHPDNGLTFSPYPSVEPLSDVKFSVEELSIAGMGTEPRIWGSYDGSGEDIYLTFDEYWNAFVWDTDFTKADQISVNQIGLSGNSIENVAEIYEDCLFVQYDVQSKSGLDELPDWASLKLVFQTKDGVWYLSGLIHGQWTV